MKQQINLLMLNFEFPPIGGGAANANYYMLKEFSKIPNLNVTLVTTGLEQKTYKFSENVTIHKIKINKKSLHFWTKSEVIKYLFKNYFYIKKKLDIDATSLHFFINISISFCYICPTVILNDLLACTTHSFAFLVVVDYLDKSVC